MQNNQEYYDISGWKPVLNSVIVDNDLYGDISEILSSGDFYLKEHADVFLAMKDCLSKKPANRCKLSKP